MQVDAKGARIDAKGVQIDAKGVQIGAKLTPRLAQACHLCSWLQPSLCGADVAGHLAVLEIHEKVQRLRLGAVARVGAGGILMELAARAGAGRLLMHCAARGAAGRRRGMRARG